MMLRLLIPCLLWLSGVYCHEMHMHMAEHMEMKNSVPPCPPPYHGIVYSQQPSHSPPPVVVKPFEPMAYLKKEVTIHQMPNQIQYIHQPPYQPVMHKPMVTYLQSAVHQVHQVHQPMQSIVKPYVEPVAQPKLIYQKPMYIMPIYQKPMYDAMPKIYLKKIEQPQTQVVYQKPMTYKPIQPQPMHIMPIQYQPPKIVHVQQPSISYIKVPQVQLPMSHPAPLIHPGPTHGPVLLAKVPEVKPCP